MYRAVLIAAIWCPLALPGDSPSFRAENFEGTWDAEGPAKEVWDLHQNGSTQTIVRTEDGKVTLTLKCKLAPGPCRGMDSGKTADVTTYTSGQALVHMEVSDTNLIVRRFRVEGHTLIIESRKVTGRVSGRVSRFVRRIAH